MVDLSESAENSFDGRKKIKGSISALGAKGWTEGEFIQLVADFIQLEVQSHVLPADRKDVAELISRRYSVLMQGSEVSERLEEPHFQDIIKRIQCGSSPGFTLGQVAEGFMGAVVSRYKDGQALEGDFLSKGYAAVCLAFLRQYGHEPQAILSVPEPMAA